MSKTPGSFMLAPASGAASGGALRRSAPIRSQDPERAREILIHTGKPNDVSDKPAEPTGAPPNFIRTVVTADLEAGRHATVVTRFPPEPNGYLHIGHAKSICLNFGVARDYGGHCNLRFDDTNPDKESEEFARAIEADVAWLGFEWGGKALHASDYFEQLYAYACDLVRSDKAYVDSLSAEEIRAFRGTLTEPGRNSPYRDRTVEENLDLFGRMRTGEFDAGAHVLRAKIDMASPNINLRDPTLYRIRRSSHHRTGEAWPIYPMYDFTHCVSDAIEGVTHSLCTLEFEDHRPLYDWVLDNLEVPCHPQQIEFARLELNYTITSKRRLMELVTRGDVSGWDDPRLPTLKGMRRRGYPPAAIREFCERVGVTKKQTVIDMGVLENCVREELDRTAPRAMAVLDPVRLVITNWPAGRTEWMTAPNHPKDASFGTREVPLTGEVWIERSDFMEDPPKKFHRLSPGNEVRLRFGYVVRCESVVRDDDGAVAELHCVYDPLTGGGGTPDGRKVRGIIHWVSCEHAIPIEVRLFDRLFNVPDPASTDDFRASLNPDSLETVPCAYGEPAVLAEGAETFQFERTGYFRRDGDVEGGRPVFNRTVSLRDTWGRIAGN